MKPYTKDQLRAIADIQELLRDNKLTVDDIYSSSRNSSKPRVIGSLPLRCKDKNLKKDGPCKYPVGSCELCRQ